MNLLNLSLKLCLCFIGHENIVELLIQKGANVHVSNPKGNSPLSLAADRGFENVVEMLIEMGVDIHVKTTFNDTALTLAAGAGNFQLNSE